MNTLRNKFWAIALAVLVPLSIAGISFGALSFAEQNPDRITAAIVNEDEPVTVDGQMVPLGRQLAAELKKVATDNFDWVITKKDEAEEGLESGKYLAMLYIPDEFSSQATSFSGDVASQVQAQVSLIVSPNTRIFEATLAEQITSQAISSLSASLTENYLENVLLGFSTMGDELVEAVDGVNQLADGSKQLDDGLQQLADGAQELAAGTAKLASDIPQYTNGVIKMMEGLKQIPSALPQLEGFLKQLEGLLGQTMQQAGSLAASTQQHAQGLATLAQQVCADDPEAQLCTDLAQQAEAAGQIAQGAGANNAMLQQAYGMLHTFLTDKQYFPAFTQSISQVAGAADQLIAGSKQLNSGTQQLASGAGALSQGLSEVAESTPELTDGIDQLAEGLATAVEELPNPTAAEAKKQAEIVTSPVVMEATDSPTLGNLTPWLFAALALWLSTMSLFFVLPAHAGRNFGTARSITLTLKQIWLPAVLGVVQAAIILGFMMLFEGFLPPDLLTGSAVGLFLLAGVAFALVNQLLSALFGGTGKVIAMLAAGLTVLTGLISQLPTVITSLSGLMPSTMLMEGAAGIHPVSVGIWLALWLVAAFFGIFAVTSRQRTVAA